MKLTDPKLDALRSIEVLRDLPSRRLKRLSGMLDEVALPAGTTLIHQGQLNRHAYFLQSGLVSIEVDGEEVATVGAGSVVGERTAITHGTANATVTTVEPTTVLAVDHRGLLGTAADDESFRALLDDLAEDRSNRAA